MKDFDIVVLGFGGAGAAAAIAAQERGARVCIIEKMPEELAGGSTRVSGNVWYGPENPDRAATYLRNLCGDRPLDESLVAAWSNEVTRTTQWVRGLGAEVGLMELPKEFPEVDGCDSDLGFHHVMPGWGHGRLYATLKRAVNERQIPVSYGTRALRLEQDADGCVTGVLVAGPDGERRIRAGAVVLATGGFTNNPALARTYLRLPSCTPWGSAAATGDGLLMAQKAGAGLANMENFMGMLGFSVPDMTSGFNAVFTVPNWLLVDDSARRFCDETAHNKHGKVLRGSGYALAPERRCYAIFDETARRAGPLVANREEQGHGFNQQIADYRWSADNLAEIAKGWIVSAGSLDELAAKLGIDGAQLTRSVADFNADCAAGVDRAFGRDGAAMAPIEAGPYYAFKWDGLLVFTNGGPSKDAAARVLDPFGTPIRGLYAAGEVASTYSRCMAGGQMIADALAFGRIAGRTAAQEALAAAEEKAPA